MMLPDQLKSSHLAKQCFYISEDQNSWSWYNREYIHCGNIHSVLAKRLQGPGIYFIESHRYRRPHQNCRLQEDKIDIAWILQDESQIRTLRRCKDINMI